MSVASASPSGHSYHRADSADESESWQFIDSASGSVGFMPSPASGSMSSWGVVGYPNQVQPSPPAVSPLQLSDMDAAQMFPATFPDQASAPLMTAGVDAQQFLSGFQDEQQAVMGNQDFIFNEPFDNSSSPVLFPGNSQAESQLGVLDISPYYNTTLLNMSSVGLENISIPQAVDLGIPQQYRESGETSPWAPTNLKTDGSPYENTNMWNEFDVASSHSHSHSPSSGGSSRPSSSPRSPYIKTEPSNKTPSPIRGITGSGKIEKKKKTDPQSKFVIMTPGLINAHAGKPNPFECFEAMRTTARGRKGPLANEIKESALQVRRLGACFCCHSRKVKCDKERPCKNCKKLTAQVPQIICWQFQDFLPVLFPDFIRGHFKKEQMSKFVNDNILGFTVEGAEKACQVELFAGARFQSTLTVRANFFTAKTGEVLQHWHMNVGTNQLDLQTKHAAPIGIDLDNAQQREELRRRARDFIQALIFEQQYAEQVTDSFKHTELPFKLLSMVQRYAQRTDSAMVKRSLSIYAMHYVLTRQLCLTKSSILNLSHTNLVPQNEPFVTPRVLNRQVKSMLDELLLKEMQSLFDSFSKSLKPKSRKEWAPCLASFLVLCLFMEAVETAADTFVISQNEINIRNRTAPEYERSFALGICKEVENMPFRQFAYQFHQIYQTHSKDASTKAFNPLQDDSYMEFGELDNAAAELVTSLRTLLEGDSYYELDFLSADPILPNQANHPFPMDVSFNYTGKLVARFLLSFMEEKYLFDGQY